MQPLSPPPSLLPSIHDYDDGKAVDKLECSSLLFPDNDIISFPDNDIISWDDVPPSEFLIPEKDNVTIHKLQSDSTTVFPTALETILFNEPLLLPEVDHHHDHLHAPKKCSVTTIPEFVQCSADNCTARASSRIKKRCPAHGGRPFCKVPGCFTAAVSKLLCINHGGGRRCIVPGCNKSSQGSTQLCVRHGGGKRCNVPKCPRGAQLNGKCIRHGGKAKCLTRHCKNFRKKTESHCAIHSKSKKL